VFDTVLVFDKLSQLDFTRTTETIILICLCSTMLLVLLPIPQQLKKYFILMFRNPNMKKITTPAYRGLLIILSILLADSLRGLYIHNANLITAKHTQVFGGTLPTVKHELEGKMYQAQTSFYASAFTLFLLVIMQRLFSMQLKITEYEEKLAERDIKSSNATISRRDVDTKPNYEETPITQ